MSQENVGILLAAFAAVEGAEYDLSLDLLDEDIVWDMSGFELPDVAKVYRGHEGIREFWSVG